MLYHFPMFVIIEKNFNMLGLLNPFGPEVTHGITILLYDNGLKYALYKKIFTGLSRIVEFPLLFQNTCF